MTEKRSAEQSFAELVDRSFATDASAISRGRTLVAAHSAMRQTTPQRSRPLRAPLPAWRAILGAGVLAGAAALVLVAVGGRDRQAPVGGVGSIGPSSIASIDTSVVRSSTDLDAVVAAAQTGDSATFAVVVGTYESDLAAVAAGLTQPGADLDAVRTKLKTEKVELARALQAASADNKGLVIALQARLDRILASLGDGPPPAPSGHGNSGASGGAGTGNGTGGNAGGNGGGAGGNGNGNGNGAGGGNSAGGNGKGHPKVK